MAFARRPGINGSISIPLIVCAVVLLSLGGSSSVSGETSQDESLIRTARDVKTLPRADAQRSPNVVIDGVVTCVPDGWKGFFVQDASGGVYCEAIDGATESEIWPIHLGEYVRVEGVVAPGKINPFIFVKQVANRSQGTLPEPPLRTLQNVVTMRDDANFVRVRGHIGRLVSIAGQMEYDLVSTGATALVAHMGFRVEPPVGHHTEVEIVGVVLPQPQDSIHPIKILVPDADHFKVVAYPDEVYARMPKSTIREILSNHTIDSPPLVRISAATFSVGSDQTWLIADGKAIEWRHAPRPVSAAIRHLELAGFVDVDGERRSINDGEILRSTPGSLPAPRVMKEPFTPQPEDFNSYIAVEATFRHHYVFDSNTFLAFEMPQGMLSARLLPDHSATDKNTVLASAEYIVGATYRVAGLLDATNRGSQDHRVLLVRSADDITYLHAAPWPVHLKLYVAILASIGLAFCLAVALTSRRTLRRAQIQTAEAQSKLSAMNEMLEQRIVQRTQELRQANEQLLDEARERMQTEQEKAKLDRRLEDARLLAQIGSFYWDAATDSTTWCAVTSRIHGLAADARAPSLQAYRELIVPADQDMVMEYARSLLATRLRKEIRYRIQLPTGQERSISAVSRALFDDAGKLLGVEGAMQDITEIATAEERLSHSLRMDAVGRLAGGVAHDLNNTLTVIQVSCYLLLQQLDHDSGLRSHVSAIQTATDKSALLTRQLLTYSRRQLLQPVTLHVNQVVREFLPLLERLVGDQIRLMQTLDPHAGSTRLDPGQFEQILMNLVINARDAIEGEGIIEIETAAIHVNGDLNASDWELPPAGGTYVGLTVRDSGAGISAELRKRIFEPFYTTKSNERGTGLGLAVIHGIVKQNNGGLRVHSLPGQGCTFQVLLPEWSSPDANDAFVSLHAEANADQRARESILLVDDDLALVQLTTKILTSLGYQVLTAHSGHEALEMLHTCDHPVDLIITDYSMPEMNGTELVAKLRQHWPQLAVMYMSGYLSEQAFEDQVPAADRFYLQKPFSITTLATTIRRCLAKSRIVNRVGTSTDR